MSKKKWFWIGMATFSVVYLALRVFWITGDPGIAAAWEYGYNATDEGYYLAGGKEKLLWGFFVDLARGEAFTYGFSAGTHWLSYLAHLVFGLSTWTWRIPFAVITFAAWISMFAYLAKKSGTVNALLLCLAFSSIPMTIAYERTASNDVLIGSLAVIAYVIAARKGRWRIFAAAAVTGLIILVKPSVWVLIPIIAAGIVRHQGFRRRWIDIACYAVASVICVFVCKMLVAVSVIPDAQQAGLSVWDVVRRTTTHYPLPNVFDFASHFKGLSAFPRDPSYVMLGVSAVFVFVLPIIMATRSLTMLRLNANTLLFVSIPAYVAAINVMSTQYTHYFIPALMFLPILVDAVGEEMSRDYPQEKNAYGRLAAVFGFVAVASVIGILFVMGYNLAPNVVERCYSRIYNFPQNNVWTVSYPAIIVTVLSVVAVLTWLRGVREARRFAPAWTVSCFFAASVVFAAVPALKLVPYLKQTEGLYVVLMAESMFLAVGLQMAIFGVQDKINWRFALPLVSVVAIAACYVTTPNWRDAACQLVKSPTHYHQLAAQELKKVLPSDAIVIGERSNQLLMSLPVRTATTFATGSNPIPVIESILKSEPKAKLYALIDMQNVYNLQHYRKHSQEYSLQPVKTFKMPSFGDGGRMLDVHLCKIKVLKP